MISAVGNNVNISNKTPFYGYKAVNEPNFGYNDGYNDRVFNAEAVGTAAGGIGAAALLRGIQWGIEKLSKVCSYALMAGKEFTTKENIDKVVETMKQDGNLTTEVHFLDETNKEALKRRLPGLENELDIVAAGKNAFFTDGANIAVAPKSKPSLILHEVGHALNFHKKGLMYALQKLRVVGMYAPMAVVALNSLSGQRNDGKQNFIERNAGKIGFLAMLPTIIEEGAASIRGVKAAKKKLGSTVKLGALKRNYFFAWMTYLLAGLGVAVASKLAVTKQ